MKYFVFILFLFCFKLSAQEQSQDSLVNIDSLINKAIEDDKNDYLPLTKSPTGAVLRSLAFPGLGQIYVEHYWKAPLFIGGAGFLWYRIISNHIDYADYKKQLDKIENKTSFEYQVLQGKMVNSLDTRDLSGLYLLGVYILSMIDAYSGAHLFDFDTNSNLSYLIFPAFDFTGSSYMKIGFMYRFNRE